MTRDEIMLFREARPDVPPYDPHAKAQARARLLAAAGGEAKTTPARQARRRSGPMTTRRRFLAVAALTTGVAVGVTVVQGVELPGGAEPGGSGGRVSLRPVADAEDLAANAALKAAAEPDDRPRPGQWSYVKTVLASSSKGSGGRLFGPPDRRLTIERWTSADGRRIAISQDGGPLEFGEDGPAHGVSPRSDYPYLLSLPTDTGALLAEIHRGIEREGGWPSERRDQRAFEVIEIYLRDVVLPARVRAAMYGALTKIPGVEYEAGAADIVGRPGVTLHLLAEGYLRYEVMIDPRTYEYLGFRYVAVRDHRTQGLDGESHVRKGQILGWGGMAESGIVDEAGRRP
ncbi:hypothetical protein SAMN04489712_11487 [Thermomonospora echinospora]|uniref:Uncharacterized protein n=1 Tax=Thermomonospora echinospora TaxID=1992 RepID=A0A1H6D8Y7_9ACTN|nr:CU044_5270 family protein [Thermomonospora echinospora]SEG81574.1 hypothetical protein SAMN04489712_11487 [Thermomonospora echinospora]